jgi:hypothetical protein
MQPFVHQETGAPARDAARQEQSLRSGFLQPVLRQR